MSQALTLVLGRGRNGLESVRLAFNGVSSRTLNLLSTLGWGLAIAAALLVIRHDGGTGYDAYAYWLAGRNVLEGNPLYWLHVEGDLGAYRYPPLIAQLWAPLALLPELGFTWVWRFACLLSLRYLAGSWRNVGLWCLVPLTLLELWMANVTFPAAALTVLALRGKAAAAAPAGLLKIAPVLAMPYLWLVRPETRRRLVVGVLAVSAACLVSFALAPDSWLLYFQALTWMTADPTTGRWGVIQLLPQGFQDAVLRLAIAIVLVGLAVWRHSDRLVYVATIIAVPVLAIWRLAPLLALPRLKSSETGTAEARQQAAGDPAVG